MLRHRVNGSVEFLLDHHHVLLVLLGDQVDGQADLPETTTTPDPVQVGGRVFGEIEIYDHVDTRHVYSSRHQVRTDQCLELPPSETFEDLQPFVLHIGSQIFVLEALALHFLGEELRPFVGSAEDDALVDDELTVDLVQVLEFLGLVDQNVVMGEAQQHELIHQVYHFRSGHEILLEALDADGECG